MEQSRSSSSPERPVAVVTGASSGIGYELAKQFAEHGYDLVIAAEDAGVARAAQDIQALGATVESVQADLATWDGVERLWNTATAGGRHPESVAINAGIGSGGEFTDTDLRTELRLVDLNCVSVVHLAKLAAREMAPRGGGRILITSSIAATMPGPYEAVYAASKAFDLSFAEALRHELKDHGVTVTALMPGPTDTEFFERADLTDTKLGQAKKDDPAEVARDGFEALMAGKDKVVAGSVKNKVQATTARAMPDPAKAAMHGKLSEPGSGTK
ncbi:MAG: oxidoreductase [Actinobacteria bacterium 13_1_20CM_3_71_11]|nr:MAG: oxidoreductase [Actinobacteria bacterium 13_1_20CM_3_71_11]